MNDEEDEEYDWAEQAFFLNCTCDHSEWDHEWDHCAVDGCDCEGGWAE